MKDILLRGLKIFLSIAGFSLLLIYSVFFFMGSVQLPFYKIEDGTWLMDKPIAHRGLFTQGSPENSISAIRDAVEEGYPVEIDILLTKDKIPVLFHDRNTYRMTGADMVVAQTNYEDLKKLRLKGTQEYIPTLQEALETVRGKVPILAEDKEPTLYKEGHNIIKDILKGYDGELAMQSYNALVCRWYEKNLPDVQRGLISYVSAYHTVRALSFRENIRAMVARPNFILSNERGFELRDFDLFRKQGMPVLVFTLSHLDIPTDYSHMPYDNVIFEIRPSRNDK